MVSRPGSIYYEFLMLWLAGNSIVQPPSCDHRFHCLALTLVGTRRFRYVWACRKMTLSECLFFSPPLMRA